MATKQEIDRIFEERTLTSFGLSIGTGLMFESIADPTTDRYDPKREIPKRVEVHNYLGHIFNVYTLIRNIAGSLTSTVEINDYSLSKVIKELKDEIEIIKSIYLSLDLNTTYPKLFIPKYEDLIKKFNFNKDVNAKYIQNNITMFKKYKPLLKGIEDQIEVLPLDGYKISSIYSGNYLFTTSFTVDLLQSSRYTLLESHTGILKDNNLWYSKYHRVGEQDLSMLPMLDVILYILGDSQLIRGLDLITKRELLNVAIDNKWSYRTTRDKVVFDCNKSRILKPILENIKRY